MFYSIDCRNNSNKNVGYVLERMIGAMTIKEKMDLENGKQPGEVYQENAEDEVLNEDSQTVEQVFSFFIVVMNVVTKGEGRLDEADRGASHRTSYCGE